MRCLRCATTLQPGFSGRPVCPLFGSCGHAGPVETRQTIARWQIRRRYRAKLALGIHRPSLATAGEHRGSRA